MKKSKVDKLIQKFKREATDAGREQGKREERARWEEVHVPDREGIVWLGPAPKAEFHRIAMPKGFSYMGFDPNNWDSMRMFERSDTLMDFKLKVKGVALANGVMIRWADWEPMGPYPVVDMPMPPRRR